MIKCEISVNADPDVIYVPTDYPTIQEAINAAISGDTIFVYSGTYKEHIVVNKSVSLVGEGRDSTIVDGDGTGTVVSIIASHVSIRGFTIKRSGRGLYNSGIFVNQSDSNDISQNTLSDSNNGINLYYSADNVVSSNRIINNKDGIALYFSSDNVVSSNWITNNGNGIGLYFSADNLVYGNTIIDNYHGLYVVLYSRNNTIYCNNFDNTYQVSNDEKNVWDDGSQGNYWSNYAGQDKNGDGLGDLPYVIDANNRDNHPLMGTFSILNVAFESETYHVTTICNSTISGFRFEVGAETGSKIIRFNVTGNVGTVGFCRVSIPTGLMNYPNIVLFDTAEIFPTLLDVSNNEDVCLYFTYTHTSHTVTIISSKTLYLYNELLEKHDKLQTDLYNMNTTYYDCLKNYTALLENYSQLQRDYLELNNSYQEQLLTFSENIQTIQNIRYILAATTAIIIIATIYLSRRAHTSNTVFSEDKKIS